MSFTVTAHTAVLISATSGTVKSITPPAVATPLPPLKRWKIG